MAKSFSMSNSAPFANKIAVLAKSRGRSQASLARVLAMRPGHLNHFLKGHGDIRAASLVRILAELGIDLEALVDLELARARAGSENFPERTEEPVDRMNGGEVLTSLVRAMPTEDRRAFVGYAVKFARETLGAPAQNKIRRLRTLWQV